MNGTGGWNFAILPAIDADGPTQMAMDLALLDHAADAPATIWWRTYTWARPTLSLGYFQPWSGLPESDRAIWQGYDVVRRPSGGGAIVHDGDLTYAIVVPSAHPWCSQARTLYQAVHDTIAHFLTEDGAAVTRRQCADGPGPVGAAGRPNVTKLAATAATKAPSPFLCFEDGDADDLVLDGVKIVGGAQRRRSWATVQHGSIRWSAQARGPGSRLPGLIDLCPSFAESSHVRWGAGLGDRFARHWNLEPRRVPFPAEVMMAAHAWSQRLRDQEWIARR